MDEKKGFSLDDRVQRLPRTVEAEVDADLLILSIDTGSCYGLNPTGARIWSLIDDDATPLADIHRRLLAEYQIEPGACAASLLALADRLRDEGLIRRAE